jgi:hypothetical protein
MLTLVASCKSEQRLCVENDNLDSAVDSIIDNWHIECDSFVSSEASSITTPVVTSLTATFDVLNCQSIAQSCLQALQASTVCSTKYTVGVDFNSCLCQSSILSLASVCEYDGNVSCKLTTANIQNVYGWGSCQGYQTILVSTQLLEEPPKLTAPQTTSMAQSVLATLTNPASQSNSATLSATAALSSSTASLTITQPPFMSGPSVTPGSVTSTQSTTSRSAAIKQQQVGDWGIFTIIIICLIFVFSSTFPQI